MSPCGLIPDNSVPKNPGVSAVDGSGSAAEVMSDGPPETTTGMPSTSPSATANTTFVRRPSTLCGADAIHCAYRQCQAVSSGGTRGLLPASDRDYLGGDPPRAGGAVTSQRTATSG